MQSKVKIDGQILKIITTTCTLGLYVAVYDENNRIQDQFALKKGEVTEEEFHAGLSNRVEDSDVL